MLFSDSVLHAAMIAIVLVPLLAGLGILTCCRSYQRLVAILFIGAAIVPMLLAFSFLPFLVRGEVLFVRADILPPLGLSFRIDPLSFFMITLFCFLGFFLGLYTWEYLREDQKKDRFYGFMLLVWSGCYGVALAGDLLSFFLFFEVMSILFFVLLSHDRTPLSVNAAMKFLFMTIIAGVALFLSVAIIFWETGTLNFGGCGQVSVASPLLMLSFLGFTIALGIKGALFPLHLWVPDAYAQAPVPAAALSSMIMLKTGVYGLVRIFGDIYGFRFLQGLDWNQPLICLAAFTIIFGSMVALAQQDLIRRLAYSGIAQVGYIFLGIALLNKPALTGAVYHILAHAFMKGTMFFCAGAILRATGKRKISELVGIGYRLPVTMACFALASFTAAGLPPFNIFISKWHLGMGALEADAPFLVVILLLSSFLNACYYFPIAANAFLGKKNMIWQNLAVAATTTQQSTVEQGRESKLDPPLAMLVPKYVIDAPRGGGKIPINYNYVLSKDDREIIMENFKGNVYKYPLPKI